MYKIFRGMASFGANMGRREVDGINVREEQNINDIIPEGQESVVPLKGSTHEQIQRLVGGLRSGISYNGAHNIVSLQQNATFIRMSAAGLRESRVHDVHPI